MNPDTLRRRAIRAHELGRAFVSWPVLAPIVALALVALVCHCQQGWTFTLAPTNAALVLFLTWHGRVLARAARVGVLAGSAAFAIPLLACKLSHACALGTCDRLTGACVAGGALAGILVGGIAGASAAPSFRALAASAVVAILMGGLSCSLAGVAGAAGLVVGVAMATSATSLVMAVVRGQSHAR